MIAELAEIDSAEAPEAADQIADALAAELEESDEPEENPTG